MKKKNNDFGKKLCIYLLALSIPCFFVIGMVQSQQYMNNEIHVCV